MVDAVVNLLIEKLIKSLLNEGSDVLEFHKQFRNVKDELLFIQNYLKDVETVRMKDRNETLKVTVGLLRERVYDAEDTISDCELFLKCPKFKRYCSPSFWKFRCQIGKKLGEINQEIRALQEKISLYLPASISIPDRQRPGSSGTERYPVLMNDGDIVDLHIDAEKIKQWVLKPHGSVNVIGIVGMGGIGKTTLAYKLYEDSEVKNFFDDVLMVIVSQTFKLEDLIKNILKKLEVTKDLTSIDLQGLLEELRGRLKCKQCLVILDDVWRRDNNWSWWESLKSGLPLGNCCVIVSTRDDEVALSMGAIDMHIHRPHLLSDEMSWSLFTKIAFAREGGQCPNPDIEHSCREIVDRCGGLPLAIKIMGGIMLGRRCSGYEWEQISKNLHEELAKKGEPISSILELSYEDLPLHLKPCMLCFAAFPEDYVGSSNNMINWWIGEGFVRERDGPRTAYEIGRDHFNELVGRNLIIGSEMDIFERGFVSFKIHDMIRDMIREIAKKENFICFDESGKLSYLRPRRVGLVTPTNLNLFKCKLVRTVIVEDVEKKEEFIKLCQLKWLRVLNIGFRRLYGPWLTRQKDWLSRIRSLQHLVYLEIENSGAKRLPNSIGNLQNLQILVISHCPLLEKLPKSIGSLEKLSTLDLVYCGTYALECLPMEIENLGQLRYLSFAVKSKVSKDAFCISGLKKLTQLRQLYLKFNSEDGIEEGELEVLSELTQLKNLRIDFSEFVTDRVLLARKMDHALSPLHQLSELCLCNYYGDRTPVWLDPTSFPNLRFLRISGGYSIMFMNSEFFGRNEEDARRFWKLEVLVLEDLSELEEEWPRMQRAMPFLRLLKVRNCGRLKFLPCELDANSSGTWRKE